jgi:hypothetical protein
MPHEPYIFHIAADSELGHLLDTAADTPVLLEKEGKRYRIVPEQNTLWAGYDPAKVRHALQLSAGLLRVDEAERLKAEIYAAREEGSRSATRP